MARLKQFIFIYGPPGVGKSVTGKILADSLNLPFYDLDKEIEFEANNSISNIFEKEGLKQFRIRESNGLKKLLNKPVGIISLGGGALLKDENRKFASKNGTTIILEASIQEIKARLAKDTIKRPLLQDEKLLEDLLKDRKDHYNSFGNKINTNSLTPKEIGWEIQKLTGKFLISGMGKVYPVHIQKDSLTEIGQILQDHQIDKNICVITDENVANFYKETVVKSLEISGYKSSFIILSPGESSKNIDTLSHIWGQLLENSLDRNSTIIALGGGVVGDLAGFAAATFLRGIDWISVPTSLLAMVDSSIGGKTGIDLPQGKNLAGAFHPPKMVLVDPTVLSTLPNVEVKNGLGEVVKHAVIDSPDLFVECSKGIDSIQQNWTQIVSQAMAVKINIIQEDPFEKGIRATLNLGHTIGHGIETLSEYTIRHGEAVAIGMVQEAKLSENLGLSEWGLSAQIESCLKNLGLPTLIPETIDLMQLYGSMQFDKKRKNGKLFFALPKSIGNVKAGIFIKDLKDQLLKLKEE